MFDANKFLALRNAAAGKAMVGEAQAGGWRLIFVDTQQESEELTVAIMDGTAFEVDRGAVLQEFDSSIVDVEATYYYKPTAATYYRVLG
jgi:hypothetical protein